MRSAQGFVLPLLFAGLLCSGLLGNVYGQDAGTTPDKVATAPNVPSAPVTAPTAEEKKDEAPAPAPDWKNDTGDTSWMLVSSALVLLMTIPGLALFYSGLVRRKNVMGTMMQSFALTAIVSICWYLFAYSLAFHEGGFWGGLDWACLKGVDADKADPYGYAGTIPHQLFMVYQLMFAIITPALICGAYAERMKFSSMCVFSIAWLALVYCPVAHWVWGQGGFLRTCFDGDNLVPTTKYAALDFAGGTVVHITSGVSALVCALFLGKRVGFPNEPMKPHNLTYSFIGACLLWVGWFGFNAGSAVGASPLAVTAFVGTHMATAAAAISWVIAEWLHHGKPTVLGGISGAVAGLVAITPASGFVSPGAGIIIGLIAGVVCYLAVAKLKEALGYDDSLDAFGVHCVGGVTGALLTGVFAQKALNAGGADGVLAGNSAQMTNQIVAVGISLGYAAVGTAILLFIINAIMGVRVSKDEEVEGLDLSQHGENGYNLT